MKTLRKVNDVWQEVENERISAGVTNIYDWRRSYQGVCAALRYLGLRMVTTKEEFDITPLPKYGGYMYRKICVARDGINSQPTHINHLLSGMSSLLTLEERAAVNEVTRAKNMILNPKGHATAVRSEMLAIEALDEILGTETYLTKHHLDETRLADVAYCRIEDESKGDCYVADQVKSARVVSTGALQFNHHGPLTIGDMISMLEAEMSLTCIGKTTEDKVDVVWFFHGASALETLKELSPDQAFRPTMRPKQASNAPVRVALNSPEFRFDTSLAEDCKRLLERKLSFVDTGVKRTVKFLNEDESQVPGECHRIELKTYLLTRDACEKIGAVCDRDPRESHGPVDFRLNSATFNARIQNKNGKKEYSWYESVWRSPIRPRHSRRLSDHELRHPDYIRFTYASAAA